MSISLVRVDLTNKEPTQLNSTRSHEQGTNSTQLRSLGGGHHQASIIIQGRNNTTLLGNYFCPVLGERAFSGGFPLLRNIHTHTHCLMHWPLASFNFTKLHARCLACSLPSYTYLESSSSTPAAIHPFPLSPVAPAIHGAYVGDSTGED